MIRLTEVYKEYPNGAKALNGLNLEIGDGEFIFMVGPSGSGKSTVIKLLTGEVSATDGRVMVNGFNLNNIAEWQIPYLRRTLGVIFQDFRLIEKKSVYDNMVFAMRAVGASQREIKKRIPYVLKLVGLDGKSSRLPDELSGGEQQRVAIARALVNNPDTIIADEPTGNLDPRKSLEIMTLLKRINELGTTVLVVTHELDMVCRFDERVVMLERGRIVRDSAAGRQKARSSRQEPSGEAQSEAGAPEAVRESAKRGE
jgi:cell division transport system ATP-binding protein